MASGLPPIERDIAKGIGGQPTRRVFSILRGNYFHRYRQKSRTSRISASEILNVALRNTDNHGRNSAFLKFADGTVKSKACRAMRRNRRRLAGG